jgi:hypothetical protein
MGLIHRVDDLRGDVSDITAVNEVLDAVQASKRGDNFSGHYKVTSEEDVIINLYNADTTSPEVSMIPPFRSVLYRHSSGLILLGKVEKSGRPYQIEFSQKKGLEVFEVDDNSTISLTDCLTEDSFSCSTKEKPRILERLSTMKRVLGQFFRVDNSENPYISVKYEEDGLGLYLTIQNERGNLPLIEHVHDNGCMVGELYHKPFELLCMTKRSIQGDYVQEELLFKDKKD